MTSTTQNIAPVLSTPDTHIFEDETPRANFGTLPKLSDEQLLVTYEIERTARDIREGKWKRIALQFPDEMLVDSPRVYEALSRMLCVIRNSIPSPRKMPHVQEEAPVEAAAHQLEKAYLQDHDEAEEKLYILGDTSYGACCVDEVAAEHVDADVVVHYGRSCLSPTARLPVIYVYTSKPLDIESVLRAFQTTYTDRSGKIILMADIPYASHVPQLYERLRAASYEGIFATEVIHNPASFLPNRTVPPQAASSNDLQHYKLFHISDPPTALLMTLSSRVDSIHIYSTTQTAATTPTALLASSSMSLRRRYALTTALSSASIFGILINTLSVKNYLHIVTHVQDLISAAGKKSYTFVVGKINAAKVANFSEIGGWVVIGCWESSLVESKDFWKPIVTPFELQLALLDDENRVWTGEWSSDFEAVLREKDRAMKALQDARQSTGQSQDEGDYNDGLDEELDSDEDSAPPEYDLRTGRLISHSRPMRSRTIQEPPSLNRSHKKTIAATSLTKRANGDLAQIGGIVSPGAEFLRSNRTWQGLGSDFEIAYDEGGEVQGAPMEEGRSGVAKGYVVGDDRLTH